MGFLTTLNTIFIVLKMTGNVDWSWFWVLSPLWLMIIVYVLIPDDEIPMV